jgi:hypothetical protein
MNGAKPVSQENFGAACSKSAERFSRISFRQNPKCVQTPERTGWMPLSLHSCGLSGQSLHWLYPVLVSGQRAYKTVRAMADDNGAAALDEHMDRAEKTIGLFYLLALVGLAALLAPIKWPKTGLPLMAITLVFALVCFGLSLYIAQEGGRVRHPEFRPAEPGETAKPSPETGHHNE